MIKSINNLFLFLLTSLLIISACGSKKNLSISPKPFNFKDFGVPNGLAINDSIFCDQTEISNIDYKAFMYDMNRRYKPQVMAKKSLHPDMSGNVALLLDGTSKWKFIPLENYYTDMEYDKYPVVGISKEQALEYADWRSAKVYEMILVEHGMIDLDEVKRNQKKDWKLRDYVDHYSRYASCETMTHYPQYYLPDSNDYKLLYSYIKNKKIKLGQINSLESARKHQKNTGLPISPIKGFSEVKSNQVIYDLIGNVSELLVEKGYTAGGNFYQTQNELLEMKITKEPIPSYTVGMRNFCQWVKIERE